MTAGKGKASWRSAALVAVLGSSLCAPAAAAADALGQLGRLAFQAQAEWSAGQQGTSARVRRPSRPASRRGAQRQQRSAGRLPGAQSRTSQDQMPNPSPRS